MYVHGELIVPLRSDCSSLDLRSQVSLLTINHNLTVRVTPCHWKGEGGMEGGGLQVHVLTIMQSIYVYVPFLATIYKTGAPHKLCM